jgi:hypothetical protein
MAENRWSAHESCYGCCIRTIKLMLGLEYEQTYLPPVLYERYAVGEPIAQ